MTPSTLAFLIAQMDGAGAIEVRRMFGAHCIYCDGKTVAFAFKDRLFLKITAPGRAFLGDAEEVRPAQD